MPGFRPIDLLVLAVIALLFFGPKRLPEMGSAVGKTIKEFQKSMREVTHPNEAPVQQTLPTVAAPAAPAPQITTSAPELAREPVAPASTTANTTVAAEPTSD